jgi:hypothetical protein
MYDVERSLVIKYSDRPFVLIGVNSDEPSQLNDIIRQRNLTWDSWTDGRGGPIALQWRIVGYPTVIIIDDKGIVRARGHGELDLEGTIPELLNEAEQRTKPGKGSIEAKCQESAQCPRPF